MVKTCFTAKPVMIQTLKGIATSVLHTCMTVTSICYEILKQLLDSKKSLYLLISLTLLIMPVRYH